MTARGLLRRLAVVVALAVIGGPVAACTGQNAEAEQAAVAELNRVAVPPGWTTMSQSFAYGSESIWNLRRDYVSAKTNANFVADLRRAVVSAGWTGEWCAPDGGSCHYERDGRVLWIVRQAPPVLNCPAAQPRCSLGTLKLEF